MDFLRLDQTRSIQVIRDLAFRMAYNFWEPQYGGNGPSSPFLLRCPCKATQNTPLVYSNLMGAEFDAAVFALAYWFVMDQCAPALAPCYPRYQWDGVSYSLAGDMNCELPLLLVRHHFRRLVTSPELTLRGGNHEDVRVMSSNAPLSIIQHIDTMLMRKLGERIFKEEHSVPDIASLLRWPVWIIDRLYPQIAHLAHSLHHPREIPVVKREISYRCMVELRVAALFFAVIGPTVADRLSPT